MYIFSLQYSKKMIEFLDSERIDYSDSPTHILISCDSLMDIFELGVKFQKYISIYGI